MRRPTSQTLHLPARSRCCYLQNRSNTQESYARKSQAAVNEQQDVSQLRLHPHRQGLQPACMERRPLLSHPSIILERSQTAYSLPDTLCKQRTFHDLISVTDLNHGIIVVNARDLKVHTIECVSLRLNMGVTRITFGQRFEQWAAVTKSAKTGVAYKTIKQSLDPQRARVTNLSPTISFTITAFYDMEAVWNSGTSPIRCATHEKAKTWSERHHKKKMQFSDRCSLSKELDKKTVERVELSFNETLLLEALPLLSLTPMSVALQARVPKTLDQHVIYKPKRLNHARQTSALSWSKGDGDISPLSARPDVPHTRNAPEPSTTTTSLKTNDSIPKGLTNPLGIPTTGLGSFQHLPPIMYGKKMQINSTRRINYARERDQITAGVLQQDTSSEPPPPARKPHRLGGVEPEFIQEQMLRLDPEALQKAYEVVELLRDASKTSKR
ncbi:hypothetical protein FMUND_13431 [Fusarium mundagurra]|uniref:Uncharacterized protein n=1 Tax=Fusarium mundagurra TaxID=1567541 RepID=A0A8H5XYJ0_9HYPO|nr:hypothetical protein FMUND_13431 [Fusarium mundagurra]